jgi:hypothetical protein
VIETLPDVAPLVVELEEQYVMPCLGLVGEEARRMQPGGLEVAVVVGDVLTVVEQGVMPAVLLPSMLTALGR